MEQHSSQEDEESPFTAKEDAIIQQRVTEWGDKGEGLWVGLEKELGRSTNDTRKNGLVS